MSHANPSRDLAMVVERAIDLLLTELEKRRLGKSLLGLKMVPKGKPSRISNAARREVYERDGIQCTYVARDGRRCQARAFLELDHEIPKALGGSNDSRNLRVRCRAHNQLWARQAFGAGHIARSRRFRQQKSTHGHDLVTTQRDAAMQAESRTATLEKVRAALRGLGFRDVQVRTALAEVARMHAPNESLTLEQVLREALFVAIAA